MQRIVPRRSLIGLGHYGERWTRCSESPLTGTVDADHCEGGFRNESIDAVLGKEVREVKGVSAGFLRSVEVALDIFTTRGDMVSPRSSKPERAEVKPGSFGRWQDAQDVLGTRE